MTRRFVCRLVDASMRRRHAAIGGFALALALGMAAVDGLALPEGEAPPYIETPPRVAERMLAVAKVTATDHVIDLGSGDGRIVIRAVKHFGASGLGVDIRADLVALSRRTAEREGVATRAQFAHQDALETDLSRATVLTLYLSPDLNVKLMPRILETMRPGARIVGHDFGIGTWAPDHAERMEAPEKNFGRGGESTIMLWIVPANAAGRWRASIGSGTAQRTLEFSITQQFQFIDAALHTDAGVTRLARATLAAERITLELAPEFVGEPGAQVVSARIEGDRMIGVLGPGGGDPSGIPFVAQRLSARPARF